MEKVCDVGLNNDFLNMTPKTQARKPKVHKWDYIKSKSFFTTKDTTSKMETQPVKWEKIFANHLSCKGLVAKLGKELLQLNSKK